MEFSIRNKFIKKYLSNYSSYNELKIIKYLAIIGIDFLRKSQKSQISYETIQNLAKTISSDVPKDTKNIKKELTNLKCDLLKLTEKIEQNTKSENTKSSPPKPSSQPTSNPKQTHVFLKKNQAKGLKAKTGPAKALQKEANDTSRKVIHQESTNVKLLDEHIYPDWWQENCKLVTKENKEVTPKITESEAPTISLQRSVPTRHHLDDKMAKQLLYDEDLPETMPSRTMAAKILKLKEEDELRDQKMQNNTVADAQQNYQSPANQFKSPNLGELSSPKFYNPNTKASQPVNNQSFETSEFDSNESSETENQENQRSRGNVQKSVHKPILVNQGQSSSYNTGAQLSKLNKGPQSKTFLDNLKNPQDKRNYFRNVSSKASHSSSDADINLNKFTKKNTISNSQTVHSNLKDYSHVGSKIKDELNLQRQLTKQYHRQRNSHNDASSEGAPSTGPSRDTLTTATFQNDPDNKFVLLKKMVIETFIADLLKKTILIGLMITQKEHILK